MVITSEPVACSELLKTLPQLFTECLGDPDRRFSSVASPDEAPESSALFLATPKAFAQGITTKARVLVVSKKSKPDAEKSLGGDRTILIATNVELAMATVISRYFLKTPYTNRTIVGISKTATVTPGAVLDPSVRVGPHAFIGAGVRLGPNVYIGANSVIEDDAIIGENTVIHPLVFIGHSTQIGKNCEVHPNTTIAKEGYGYAHDERGNHYRVPHQGRVVLEDEVHIGSGCTIDRATFLETRIKFGAKFDNQIHIAHNCVIGKNAILTSGFTMAGSSKIGANFVTGGATVVSGHLEVCDNVQVAALSGIAKSITTPGQYGGLPLMPLQQFIRSKAALVHLPEMRKQLKAVMKKLGLDEASSSPTE